MKVLNLRCDNAHSFEGWFGSEQDFQDQTERGLLACPVCASLAVQRMPSAPHLNLSGVREPATSTQAAPTPAPSVASAPAQVSTAASGMGEAEIEHIKSLLTAAVHQLIAQTEDVGERFPDEVRRMHYGEIETRGIRGQASAEQKAELLDEGIEVLSLPLPDSLKGPTH
jgi:hypothetical protein